MFKKYKEWLEESKKSLVRHTQLKKDSAKYRKIFTGMTASVVKFNAKLDPTERNKKDVDVYKNKDDAEQKSVDAWKRREAKAKSLGWGDMRKLQGKVNKLKGK